jgi:hypothetical protein
MAINHSAFDLLHTSRKLAAHLLPSFGADFRSQKPHFQSHLGLQERVEISKVINNGFSGGQDTKAMTNVKILMLKPTCRKF